MWGSWSTSLTSRQTSRSSTTSGPQTVIQARELLEHQIEMAQRLAQFLGENTAKGEDLVEKLMLLTGDGGESNGKPPDRTCAKFTEITRRQASNPRWAVAYVDSLFSMWRAKAHYEPVHGNAGRSHGVRICACRVGIGADAERAAVATSSLAIAPWRRQA